MKRVLRVHLLLLTACVAGWPALTAGLEPAPRAGCTPGRFWCGSGRSAGLALAAVAPAVQASPAQGTIGSTTAITGQGFGGNEPISVTLQYTNTGVLDNRDVPGTAQAIATTDGTGSFSGTFSVRSSLNALIPGTYSLTATGSQTNLTAHTPFTVLGSSLPAQTFLFFADGSTQTVAGGAAADFTETLSILNANSFATTYTLTYYVEQSNGPSTTMTVTGAINANSVVECSVNADVGANQRVSVQLSSTAVLGGTRTIVRTLNGAALAASSSPGQLVDAYSTAPSFAYYLASGEQLPTTDEYLTLLNPTGTAANVQVTVLPDSGQTVPGSGRVVPAMSRLTVPLRDLLQQAGLATGTTFGLAMSSDRPLACEQTDYFGTGSGAGRYATAEIAAAGTPARQYIFANDVGPFPATGGNTTIGTGNDLSELDVINPAPAAAGSATVPWRSSTRVASSSRAGNSRLPAAPAPPSASMTWPASKGTCSPSWPQPARMSTSRSSSSSAATHAPAAGAASPRWRSPARRSA